MLTMKVLKFGGTSLGSENSIRKVSEIIFENESDTVVVVSAIGNTTDKLYETAQLAKAGDSGYIDSYNQLHDLHVFLSEKLCGEVPPEVESVFEKLLRVLEGVFLLKELTNRSLDFILGSGELLSSIIVSGFFSAKGRNTKRFDSREIIITDDQFGSANVISSLTDKNIKEAAGHFESINVFPGFIAGTESREFTTLGRGGSDYTASLLAASLEVDLLEIWTDVDGIMTADPRKVRRSHTLEKVSYEEALELSHFGAKVIYAQSISPVFNTGISVVVKNTFEPEKAGTLITQEHNNNNKLIKGISSIDKVSIMSVSGNASLNKIDFFPRLFKVLADNQVEIVFMTHSNSEYTVTLGFKASEAKKALMSLKREFRSKDENSIVHSEILEENYSLLALIGSKMKDQVGVSGKMFNVLGKNGISIKAISQGSSERNISAIIPGEDLSKALNVLHESFFLSEMRRLNLFIIGTGNVGKAFLDQITGQFSFLKTHHQLNVKVIGVANSRKMAFEKDGIPLSKWSQYLDRGDAFEKQDFFKTMKDLNFRNSIFIDITASEEISRLYTDILAESISVVTPNKIAATRSYEDYLKLKDARKCGSQFLIETNVCAGLPVLSTLNDLVRSGDQVNSLEAVLSGTLNFLFNEYDGKAPFSEVIKKAKDLGYTEPDPRLDISGEDVMRKLLILIRESTYAMEMDEIEIESFLPESCKESSSLEDFYAKIDAEEDYFRALYEQAKSRKCRLKVVASFQNGKGKVSLQEIPETHPFYHLEGKDNVVLFYTNRYKEQPLVIKGAGAGAEVTASGIFADVLRIAQSDN